MASQIYLQAGRDVIGVAKTGSGKTLSYLLPMLRHITGTNISSLQPKRLDYESFLSHLIQSHLFLNPFPCVLLDQPQLEPHESGPIGLVLAPARELAYQIHLVCKSFTKALGLK